MKQKINFYFDNFFDNFTPVPNGETKDSKLFDFSIRDYHQMVKASNSQTNFNEFLNNRFTKDGKNYIYYDSNYEISYSNELKEDAKNIYLIMPKMHFYGLDSYLDFYQTKLEQGFVLLFASFHEIGDYNNFYNWINNNQYKDNIIIISIASNLQNILQCRCIFFPFLLYDFGNDFTYGNSHNSVCIEDDYVNTPKEKLFVSWNKNTRRFHRLIFYEFLKLNNLLNNYVSFLDFPERELYLHYLTDPNYSTVTSYLKDYIENGAERIDLDLHGIPNNEIQSYVTNRNNQKEFYAKSHFSIVTETNFYEKFNVLTEKMLRPLANFHPFIIIGTAGSYRILKEIGFKIPKIIDYELIDETHNPNLRLIRTFEEIKKLISYLETNGKLPNFDIEDLYHNQNLLLTKNKINGWTTLYSRIYNIMN
jgi:hypothetical protein